MERQNLIIIKKVKRGGHGGSHGGSWKVAYADFVTALMAFFLLLWLISMVAPEKRARVAHYFKNFSIFEKSGNTMLDSSKATSMGLIVGDEGEKPSVPKEPSEETETSPTVTKSELFKLELQEKVVEELGDVKDQVIIQTFDGGVRIEVVDLESSPMFPRGRSDITAEGKKVLEVICRSLMAWGNKVALEGHTDAFGHLSKQVSNWDLSTQRASAARKELERLGFPDERLVRVAGLAATEPLIKENIYDPRNRRISLVVFEEQPVMADVISEPQPVHTGSNATTVIARVEPQAVQEKPHDPVQSYLFNSKSQSAHPGSNATTVIARVVPQTVQESPPPAGISKPEPVPPPGSKGTAAVGGAVPLPAREEPLDPAQLYLFHH